VGRTLENVEYGVLSLDFGVGSNDNTCFFITKGCSAVVQRDGKFRVVTQGHYKDELWGLATNQKDDLFVTGGDDSTVRLWSIRNKEEVCRYDLKGRRVRGIDWAPNGDKIIFGDDKAVIRLLDTDLKLLSEHSGKPAQ
jgi:WD40 repeat protein